MEEQVEYLISLGEALYKFYDGQTLTSEELTLIASSSNDDKVMALDFNASKRLGMRTDRSLDNYIKNSNSLKLMNFNTKTR
mgnify:CR=1 FL=1